MRRRLLLALAPLLLAATEAPPQPAELGTPLTLTLPLPAGALPSGFPDLAPFALRQPPRIVDGRLVLELVPLRPGRHLFPPLPLLDDRNRPAETSAVTIEVSAPEPPPELLPLRELPATAPLKTASGRWMMAVSAALLMLVLAGIVRWRRRPAPPALSPLDQLAQRFLACADPGAERWRSFRCELERLRFAPVAPAPETVTALAARFDELLREES